MTFGPDGTFRGLEEQAAPAGRWEMTEEGLVVAQGEWKWLFQAGPMNSMLGTGRSADIAKGVRKAMLRPVEPAAEPVATDPPAAQPQPAAAQPAAAEE